MSKQIRTSLCLVISALILNGCASLGTSPTAGTSANSPWAGNYQQIWETLQQSSSTSLASMQAGDNDPIKAGWIQLALISKRDSRNTPQLIKDLIVWRSQNPSHPGNNLLPDDGTLQQLLTQPKPAQVAVLLPQSGAFGSAGQTVKSGLMSGYYASVSAGNKQNIKFYDTTGGATVDTLYQQAISEGADAVIGPLAKPEVQTLLSKGNISAQTLALNYTKSFFSSLPSNFYEFGLLPEDDIAQMVQRARRDGVSNAIVIAPQSDYGQRMLSAFTAQWKANGGNIEDQWTYTSQTDFNAGIAALLKVDPVADKKLSESGANRDTLSKQRRQDFDVIFIFSNAQDGRVIVPLLRYYYADNIPVFATSSIYSGRDIDLNGVTVCDIPMSIQSSRNPDNTIPSDKLYAVGQDAYTITQNLPRMIALPNFPLYGQTGALYLSSDHQIHRHIPCSTIQNGSI